jgi:hypothetical protein
MTTRQRTAKAPKREQPVSAERVKEMLREIAFVLHATRVVRRSMAPSSSDARARLMTQETASSSERMWSMAS